MRDGSSSSPGPAGASAAATPSSSPARAPRSWSTTSGPRWTAPAASAGPAHEVVETIKGFGGEAIANGEDVSDWDGANRLITTAIDTFGGLDVLVNNAGILRDRMLINMTIEEWDAVIRVHLRGTFAPSRVAAAYWRERSKAGETNDARIINTSSSSGIYGNPGQTNYGAAKAGIAAFTIIAAMELDRYGVTVNAIAPGRPDPHDREPAARPTGAQGRRVRRPAPRQRRPARGLAGQPRVGGRHRAASSTWPAAASAWPRAGAPARASTRATAGTLTELGAVIPGLVEQAAPNAGQGGARARQREREAQAQTPPAS